MGKFKLGILIFMCLIAVASCEKDDICVEGDTPLLVIEFYNSADTAALKNVTALRVVGEGQNTTVNTVSDRSNTNKISVPLKTNEDNTRFIFIANSASDENGAETGNVDTINFTYNRLEEFLSRGCGFVINYDSLQSSVTTGADNWIQEIEIVQSQIINSDSTHVKIFH